MTAKEYLSQAYHSDKRIDAMQERIAVYQDRALKATSTVNALRTSGTGAHSKLEDAVCRYVDMQVEVAGEITQFYRLHKEIADVIGRVENETYRNLLDYRYLSFMTWGQVAVKMGYSYYHITHDMHSKALSAVQKIIHLNPPIPPVI